MARKFLLPSGMFAYALELCEETQIINLVESIAHRIPPTESWFRSLLWRLYEQGHPLAEDHFQSINSNAIRCGFKPLTLRETNPIDGYIRQKNYEEHADNRRAIRDKLLGATPEERQMVIAEATEQVEALEPAHRTWEQLTVERRLYERTPQPILPLAPRGVVEATNNASKCGTVIIPSDVPSNGDRAEENDGAALLQDTKPASYNDMNRLLRTIPLLEDTAIKGRLIEFILENCL